MHALYGGVTAAHNCISLIVENEVVDDEHLDACHSLQSAQYIPPNRSYVIILNLDHSNPGHPGQTHLSSLTIPPIATDMPPNLARTWAALEEREVVRALYAREAGVPVGQGRARAAPELIYYSTLVARANGNREANRYSNVLPYDRTLVAPDGEYVNASVVVAGSMWWVAAQVSAHRAPQACDAAEVGEASDGP